MFGRKGHLINILDLYYFNPIEIMDIHSSMYDKKYPIEYKKKVFEPTIEHVEYEKQDNAVMNTIYEKFARAMTYNEDLKNDDDWYSYFSLSSEYLKSMGVEENELKEYLIAHICEQLTYNDEVTMLNEVYKSDGEIELLIQNYYEKFIVRRNNIIAIILINFESKDSIENIFVLNENKWREATYTERNLIAPYYNKSAYKKPLAPMYKVVGFMGLNKATESYEFKVRVNYDTKKTGAVVENKSKAQIIALLNDTINKSDAFTAINTKTRKKNELCVIEELMLRYYDNNNNKKARSFFNKLEFYYLNKN
jgi:hypothetical protein